MKRIGLILPLLLSFLSSTAQEPADSLSLPDSLNHTDTTQIYKPINFEQELNNI